MDTNKMLLAAVLAFQVFLSLGGCQPADNEKKEAETIIYNVYITQNADNGGPTRRQCLSVTSIRAKWLKNRYI